MLMLTIGTNVREINCLSSRLFYLALSEDEDVLLRYLRLLNPHVLVGDRWDASKMEPRDGEVDYTLSLMMFEKDPRL